MIAWIRAVRCLQPSLFVWWLNTERRTVAVGIVRCCRPSMCLSSLHAPFGIWTTTRYNLTERTKHFHSPHALTNHPFVQVFATALLLVTLTSVTVTVYDERRNINKIQNLVNQLSYSPLVCDSL